MQIFHLIQFKSKCLVNRKLTGVFVRVLVVTRRGSVRIQRLLPTDDSSLEASHPHYADVVFHSGECDRLRIVVRSVHRGTGLRSGAVAHSNGGVEVPRLLFEAGGVEEVIRLEAQLGAFVRVGEGGLRKGGRLEDGRLRLRDLAQMRRNVLQRLLNRIGVVRRERIRVVSRVARRHRLIRGGHRTRETLPAPLRLGRSPAERERQKRL